MIHVKQHTARQGVVLEFTGSFDVRGAEELLTFALQQPPSSHLVIDVSRASSIHDAALGRLVEVLPRFSSHAFRGLNLHQARLLWLLGGRSEEGDQRQALTD